MAQRRRSDSSETEFHIDISGAGRTSILATWPAFFAPGTAVTALPSWKTPRLLVPQSSLRGRWQSSRMYPAFRRRAKLFRLALRAAASLSVLPSRTVKTSDWPLEPILKQYLPETDTLSVLIGTPGVGQKLTVECRDEHGRAVGYIKYADGSVATAQLRNEADVLKAVPQGAGPEVLACVRWQRGLLLLTRPVQGRPVRAELPPPDALAGFARALTRPEKVSLYEHPWVRRTNAAETLPRALQSLEGREWSVAVQHGDLAAWNLRETDTGLQAFDWEYGTRDGFPYLDLAHFVLQHGALIARWPSARAAAVAADYLRAVADDGLSTSEAVALTQLAAFDAYRNDPSADDDPLQQWRMRIWRAGE